MGGSGSDAYANEMRATEQMRQWKIRSGTDAINRNFAQFNDDFYNKRGTAYLNYAMPQLNQQHDDANRGLVFALARQGIGNSSEGNRRYGALEQDFGIARQNIVDKSIEAQNEARRSIEDARSGLLQDLYNTADPAAAAKGSVARAAYLNQPTSISPIGQLFGNTLSGLNTYREAKSDAEAYRDATTAYPLGGAPSGSASTYGS
jgi:hypothetical protein